MAGRLRNDGFSLTEVLIAAGILAIGFAFIAGLFPVGVKLTAIATEQTIAPIVADEAIAKIKLYGELYTELDNEPNLVDVLYRAKFGFLPSYSNGYVDFADALPGIPNGDPCEIDEFAYPSADITPELKKYHWSALCGLQGDGNVHVTIFVSRKAGAGARYLTHNPVYTSVDYGQADPDVYKWPVPVKMDAEIRNNKQKLIIDATSDEKSYISTTSTIVDDATGWLYRVIKRKLKDDDIIITLDRKWEGPVVPPVSYTHLTLPTN